MESTPNSEVTVARRSPSSIGVPARLDEESCRGESPITEVETRGEGNENMEWMLGGSTLRGQMMGGLIVGIIPRVGSTWGGG